MERSLGRLFVPLLPLLICSSVFAENAQDIEQRIEKLESQIKDYAKQIQILEQESKRTKRGLSNLSQTFDNLSDRFEINGFMSVGASYLDQEGLTWGSSGADNEVNWSSDSVFGMQMNFSISDQMEVVSQFVSSGGRDSRLDTDWFYINYAMNEQTDIIVGRFRSAFYLMSEYIEVGFAYPWVRPPIEIYDAIPTDITQGLLMNHRRQFADFDLFLSAYTSQSVDEGTISNFDAQINQLQIELAKGDWSVGLRLGRGTADIELVSTESMQLAALLDNLVQSGDIPNTDDYTILPEENAEIDYYSASFRYDNGEWLALAEVNAVQYEGLFSDTDSHYITIGKRFGDWLPHLTYAKSYSVDDRKRNALYHSSDPRVLAAASGLSRFTVQNTSYHFGLNYNVTPRVTAKFEAQWVTNLNDTIGQFDVDEGTDIGDDVWIYTILVDTVF